MVKQTKQTKKQNLKLIDRNGKTYIAIKTIGGRNKYYKYNPNIPLDAYNEYAKNPIKPIKEYKQEYKAKWLEKQNKIHKKIGTRNIKGSLRMKRRKPVVIEDSLKKGLTITTIPNVTTAGAGEFQKAYRELLKPLVLDKQLLKMLATEETISKLRYRIEQKYTFNGQIETGRGNYEGLEEKLGQATTIGTKTPREAANTVKQIMENNQLIYLHQGSGSTTISKLESNGFTYRHQANGQVNRTDLTLIFRKG